MYVDAFFFLAQLTFPYLSRVLGHNERSTSLQQALSGQYHDKMFKDLFSEYLHLQLCQNQCISLNGLSQYQTLLKHKRFQIALNFARKSPPDIVVKFHIDNRTT
ncbi:hypothetical protein GGU11DRAFT_5563 [Lentinula aff. detonsa]|nr:hypothetical protein GGU11DRAFT_5563 [Lentinula aff. detonsa]